MAKFNKFGREFLLNKASCPDVAYWSLRFSDEGYWNAPKDSWTAVFNIRINNTSILLHSNNENDDVNFVKFLWKLHKLESAIKQFMETTKKGPKGFKSIRTWLNPENTKEEHYFNGYVVQSFEEASFSRISIADCNRSIIISFADETIGGSWAKRENRDNYRRLETVIKQINAVREAAKQIIEKVEKRDPVEETQIPVSTIKVTAR
ncbi:hypothetical protein AVA65_07645 [Salmonella enterica subsp. enterica serovar Minnesota]|nr:hypothetical protein [Salmonella enterica subsp. enterica serovar Minnesota]